MSDLREMIDDTTERLLRKVDKISIGNPHDCISYEKEENYKKEIQKLKKQLDIAAEAIKAVLHDEFILEHADAGLVMYLTQAEYKIKELNK